MLQLMRGWRREAEGRMCVCMGSLNGLWVFLLLLFVYLKENTKLRCGEFGYVDERT